MARTTTWRPHGTHGKLTEAKEAALPDAAFAFRLLQKTSTKTRTIDPHRSITIISFSI